MSTRVIILALAAALVMGCTTTAARAPNEASQALKCDKGELKVCTGLTGSRVKKENPACSCT